MKFKIKPIIVRGIAAVAVGVLAVTGGTHLLGANQGDAFSPAEMGPVTLASAQLGGLTTGAPPAPSLPATALMPGKLLPAAPKQADRVPPPKGCTAVFSAASQQGAMVHLSLSAPCDPQTKVSIAHEGLSFDLLTDAAGAVSVDVPALSAIALFKADLAGLPLRAVAAVPDYESYSRVALQWQGPSGLGIHALEFGASYGDEGHVSSDAPGTSLRAVRAKGGFITRLGDTALSDGRNAEIYVFPAGMMQKSGTVRLTVEAEVNALTCGKLIEGEALQPGADGKMQSTALTLEIPGCDGICDILLLKNLLRDMNIASN